MKTCVVNRSGTTVDDHEEGDQEVAEEVAKDAVPDGFNQRLDHGAMQWTGVEGGFHLETHLYRTDRILAHPGSGCNHDSQSKMSRLRASLRRFYPSSGIAQSQAVPLTPQH